MRIAVFGTGGVGGYFGGRLAEAGQDVTFIARGEHLAAIRRGGLRVASTEGDFSIPAGVVRATDSPAEVGPVDVVILGVKTWQVPEAAEAIRPMVGPETVVLPLENGVEASDVLVAALGPEPVLGGLCAIVAMLEGPGRIRHAGVAPVVRFGELDNSRTERVEALRKAFARCKGVTVDVPDDIESAIWKKFVFISAWSSVGSVTRAPIGVIRTLPESRQLLHTVLAEAIALGRARGVQLPDDMQESTVAFYDATDPGNTASMQRDVAAGKPSELESQTGAIVRLGAESGIDTPAARFIYSALLPGEKIARGEVS
ncbi:MAG: 2-dehydropantoate 2-reductase [Spirochaetaceae bacterium]|nr:MAG: 2-dehydropantoate 2-reductase [Spirochaetaceae bacterium]